MYDKFVWIHAWTWKNAYISQNVQWDCTDQTVKAIAVINVQSSNNVTLKPENVLVGARLDGKTLHVMQVRHIQSWLDSAYLMMEHINVLFYYYKVNMWHKYTLLFKKNNKQTMVKQKQREDSYELKLHGKSLSILHREIQICCNV